MLRPDLSDLELSVVMPCLNEAKTLGICIEKCHRVLREHKLAGEVIVADNGSTDGSQAIAARMRARLVHVATKRYGSALMGGIAESRLPMHSRFPEKTAGTSPMAVYSG